MVRAEIDQLYALDQAIDEGEELIRTADGRTRVWTFRSAPLGSDSRGRRLVVSMAADVTERKEAERALRESEIRMRALLDASQDEILLLSTEGEVLAINKAAERRLARRMGGADPVGAHLDRLLPRDQVESRMADRPTGRLDGDARALRRADPLTLVRVLVLSGDSRRTSPSPRWPSMRGRSPSRRNRKRT